MCVPNEVSNYLDLVLIVKITYERDYWYEARWSIGLHTGQDDFPIGRLVPNGGGKMRNFDIPFS